MELRTAQPWVGLGRQGSDAAGGKKWLSGSEKGNGSFAADTPGASLLPPAPIVSALPCPPKMMKSFGFSCPIYTGFLGGSVVKNPPAKAEDAGLVPGSGRSPGEGNGNPLQFSCQGNPMDRGDWSSNPWAHKSQT